MTARARGSASPRPRGSGGRQGGHSAAHPLEFLLQGPGYFVTGTGTGVGKTWTVCSLARLARARGRRVGVLKPAESGDGGDAAALKAASGCPLPLEVLRPYAFRAPMAPSLAAEREGRRVAWPVLRRAFKAVSVSSDFMLVEGAGGLLVPYAPGLDAADLAQRFGLPLLLVAARGLGTINHSLLSLEAARRRGLAVAALVLSAPAAKGDPSVEDNARLIARLGRVKVVDLGQSVVAVGSRQSVGPRFLPKTRRVGKDPTDCRLPTTD